MEEEVWNMVEKGNKGALKQKQEMLSPNERGKVRLLLLLQFKLTYSPFHINNANRVEVNRSCCHGMS